MNTKNCFVRLGALAAAAMLAVSATAEVTRIEVTSQGEIAGGQHFGDAGAFEKVAGTMYFAVDPDAAANRIVRDIAHAPRNEEGRVEFSADFFLIRPVDTERGNGTLLFDVANRGRKLMLSVRIPSPPPTSATASCSGTATRCCGSAGSSTCRRPMA